MILYNIEKFLEHKKIKNVVALFVLHTLIVNLHVAVWPFSFVLYLPYIGEYIVGELIEIVLYHKIGIFRLKRKIKAGKKLEKYQEKLEKLTLRAERIRQKREENLKNPYKIRLVKNKNARWLILVMILMLLTGFITPLGAKTSFTYTYLTVSGTTMNNINEHLPLTLINNLPIMCAIVIFLSIFSFTKAKLRLSDLFMIGGLTYLMFSTRRQQSMFALICSVIYTRMITDLIVQYNNCSLDDILRKCMNKFSVAVVSLIVIAISLNFIYEKRKDVYISTKSYPVDAAQWILDNLDVKKIRLFNEYNYGSYLLFKGIPVFIDSRCDLYAPEYNTETGDKKDGDDIFSDFMDASGIGKYYGDIFEKYEITHIILYKNSKINMLIENADSEKYDLLYTDSNFVIYEVLEY